MNDIAEHFVHLRGMATETFGSQLLTRGLGVQIGPHEALAAIDANGQRHLLIPLVGAAVDGDQVSQGVTLGSRVLRVGAEDVTYADLHSRMSSLDLVFERLVEDVVTRLQLDDSAPVTTCRKVLDEWRSLLKAAGQDVTRETVIGLVGELEVLRLFAAHNPSGALDAWRGPSKSVHDFVRNGAELEVKTTTSVDGNFVSITNLDQLDPSLVSTLHLVVVHARLDETAPSIDERIEALVDLGVPRATLLAKVADAGYVYEAGAEIEDRYQVRSVRAWHVGETFPGLRRDEIGEQRLKGVSKIHYELALDAAPKRVSDSDLAKMLATWVVVDG